MTEHKPNIHNSPIKEGKLGVPLLYLMTATFTYAVLCECDVAGTTVCTTKLCILISKDKAVISHNTGINIKDKLVLENYERKFLS